MSDDNFDDGLVHGHHWATEKPTKTGPAQSAASSLTDDGFDDGLVHSHDWASGGK